MFTETAEFYDLIYASKDYAGETQKIRDLIAREHPAARSILDVACGTAEHARRLSPEFLVQGIDLDPAFVSIARSKVPAGEFHVADMRSFDLGRRFDIVQCLFSSIGYLLTPADIVAALKCFAKHLSPGGVIFVEPWISPQKYKTGLVFMDTVNTPELKICRMNVTRREGDVSVLDFHYQIATPKGIRRAQEIHRLALIAPEEMAEHFQSAGLRCSFDSVGLFGRGLFTARAADSI